MFAASFSANDAWVLGPVLKVRAMNPQGPQSNASTEERVEFEELRRTSDPSLREGLVTRHLGLVPSVVSKFRGKAEWDDLVQVGYVGLMKAVDGYDPAQNVKFSTYAHHCITGELCHYLRDRVDLVRRPRWLSALSKQLSKYIESFSQQNNRLPSVSEIAQAQNLSVDGVQEVLRSRSVLSFDQSQPEALAVEKIRSLRYESFRLPIEDKITLMQALERLVTLERRVIYLFFYRDLTQGQIAGLTGLSPKKVSRVMHKGLEKLQAYLGLKDGSGDTI